MQFRHQDPLSPWHHPWWHLRFRRGCPVRSGLSAVRLPQPVDRCRGPTRGRVFSAICTQSMSPPVTLVRLIRPVTFAHDPRRAPCAPREVALQSRGVRSWKGSTRASSGPAPVTRANSGPVPLKGSWAGRYHVTGSHHAAPRAHHTIQHGTPPPPRLSPDTSPGRSLPCLPTRPHNAPRTS